MTRFRIAVFLIPLIAAAGLWGQDEAKPVAPPEPAPAAVESDEGVREAAEIDARALTELYPVGVGKDFGGRRGEKVTPVAFVAGREHRAGVRVRAGRDDAEVGQKSVA
jgi:hypothetical protein